MKKEALERANEITEAIEKYKNIYQISIRPCMKFVLKKQRCVFTADSYTSVDQEVISDPELAKLIQAYCTAKIKELSEELEKL